MRLFVAVGLPEVPAAHLAQALGRAPDPRWHLTLAFLGDVVDPAPLLGPLSAVPLDPFALSLAGAGTFGRGRVLWVGVGAGREPLSALAGEVAAACRSAGVALEERAFRPHLTVRRGRDLQPGPLAAYEGPGWTVERFALFASREGRYDVLEQWPR